MTTHRLDSPLGSETAIAGIEYQIRNSRSAFRALKPEGFGEAETWGVLQPEPTNAHDQHAICVMVMGRKIGYVPAAEAPHFSPALQRLQQTGQYVEVPVRLRGRDRGDEGLHVTGTVYLPDPHELQELLGPAHLSQPAPAHYRPPAPYPADWRPPKSHAAAILLSLFLGTLGIDRFYLGHAGVGIAKLLFSWMTFGVWQLIDCVLIIAKGTEGLKRINWH